MIERQVEEITHWEPWGRRGLRFQPLAVAQRVMPHRTDLMDTSVSNLMSIYILCVPVDVVCKPVCHRGPRARRRGEGLDRQETARVLKRSVSRLLLPM